MSADLRLLLGSCESTGLSVVRVEDHWIVGWKAKAQIKTPAYEPPLNPDPPHGRLYFQKQFVTGLIEMEILAHGPDLEECLNAAWRARESAGTVEFVQVAVNP